MAVDKDGQPASGDTVDVFSICGQCGRLGDQGAKVDQSDEGI